MLPVCLHPKHEALLKKRELELTQGLFWGEGK